MDDDEITDSIDPADFEGDDFANDKEIQRLRKIDADYRKLLDDCMRIVSQKLNLEEGVAEDISPFALIQSLREADVYSSFCSNGALPLQACLLQHKWVVHGKYGNRTGIDTNIVGLLTLKKEYPVTYIYKETLADKISDWFAKTDVDLKDCKRFSSCFHMVTQDKEKLKLLLLNKPMDDLARYPDAAIEIKGYKCLFKVSNDDISEEQAEKFTGLAQTLCRILL